MISSPGEADPLARTRTGLSSENACGLAVLIWGIVVGIASHGVIGPHLFLIYYYGWERVRRDGLSLVERDMLAATWIISNGDRIMVFEHEDDIFTIVPWLAIMAVTVPLLWVVYRLLTKSKRTKVAGGNG